MPKLVIKDLKPYDGEYEIAPLTLRDASTIKKISGVRAGELEEALAAGDTDVLVAFTIITLQRNGFPEVNANALWDSDGGVIRIEATDEEKAAEDADRPLATAAPNGTTGGNEKSNGSPASENDNFERSGFSGSTDGGSSQPTPLHTGNHGSLTSADFARSTSTD